MGVRAACERCSQGDGLQARALVGVVLLVLAIGCYASAALTWVVLSGGWLAVVASAVALVAAGLGLQAVASMLLGDASRRAGSSR